MSTRQNVLSAFAYYIGNGGYYEKASARNLSREVSDFSANKGSGNYTYMGKLCGVTPAPWCAQMVSTAVLEWPELHPLSVPSSFFSSSRE